MALPRRKDDYDRTGTSEDDGDGDDIDASEDEGLDAGTLDHLPPGVHYIGPTPEVIARQHMALFICW